MNAVLLGYALVQPTQLMMAWGILKVSLNKLTSDWDKGCDKDMIEEQGLCVVNV